MPRQPRIKTIPPLKHANYALLWDLADDLAAKTGRTAESCWQEIIAAFWTGELSKNLSCFTRPAAINVPGRVLLALPSREVLAEYLLEHDQINDSAWAELSGWGMNDYQEHEPFPLYTARDPLFGLAVRRVDFERWCRRHKSELLNHSTRLGGRKATKREAIAAFIEINYPNGIAGRTYKTIVNELREKGVIANERTVRRACGRK